MKSKIVTGQIMTTRSGTGFMAHPDFDIDIRIEHENLNTALNGDTVEVQTKHSKKGRRSYGEVISVTKRAKTQFVGVIKREKGYCFLVPDDRRIYTDILIPNISKDIPDGHKVLVELLEWTDSASDPTGKIVSVLGARGDHETEILSIIADKGIDTKFPSGVEKVAENIKKDWDKTGSEYIESSIKNNERRDYRDTTTFTIDPHDAKDFDDAISFKEIKIPNDKKRKLYEVGIHIADVSHFVKPNTILDKEAQERLFSTYLVDRTIPMLPEEISNDLCSLNPNTDRLTFSAVFLLDKDAKVHERWFGKTIIHSDKRFSYEEAQEILDKKKGELYEELNILNELSKKLRQTRMKSGSIDFEQDEVEIELDKQNKPTRIFRKKLKDTNKLIEDFMLLANKEVALNIYRSHGHKDIQRAFIYRIHDHPDPEKLAQAQILVRALGYDLGSPGQRIKPQDINILFRNISGSTIENTLKTVLIRSMAKAQYDTKNIGHFGLGFGYYTHFTSPIRRYPDLMVHRLLLEHIKNRHIPAGEYEAYKQLALSASSKEITIQEAERESIKYKQVEYMQSHIGEKFNGVVTGVTDWGIFIEENETGAEGLVRITSLSNDYFVLDEKNYRLVGKRTKKTYTIGDSLQVRVIAANVDQKTIDYEIA